MEQAKAALQLFLRSLPLGIPFNIISFGDAYTKLFPSPQPYSERTFAQARDAVATFQGNMGGTALLQPLQDILGQPLDMQKCPAGRQLFILTDGEVKNTKQVLDLIRTTSSTTKVFTFGVGADASRTLVEGMAREGRGKAEFVVAGERLQAKVQRQVKRALQPAVTDLSLRFLTLVDGRDISEEFTVAPQILPAVFSVSIAHNDQ
jgi:hypothetical protein